jgi:hypothetical protein
MSFEKNPPREETFEHAEAIVDICLNADDVGMALSQAIQFDCMFRQGDVIGQWRAEQATYILRPGEVRRGPKVWSGMTIDQIQPDGELAVRTSKTGQPVVHAINKCTLIMRCIERLDPQTRLPRWRRVQVADRGPIGRLFPRRGENTRRKRACRRASGIWTIVHRQ